MEIFTIGKTVIETGSTAVLMGLLVVLAVPILRKKVFSGMNGDAGHIRNTLETIESNHLHELNNKIDKLMDAEQEGNLISKEILFVLKNKR